MDLLEYSSLKTTKQILIKKIKVKCSMILQSLLIWQVISRCLSVVMFRDQRKYFDEWNMLILNKNVELEPRGFL